MVIFLNEKENQITDVIFDMTVYTKFQNTFPIYFSEDVNQLIKRKKIYKAI